VTEKELLCLIVKARNENWEQLDLSKCQLRRLPPQIGMLVNLKRLILGKKGQKNKFTYWPDELGQLKSLELLSAPHNRLTEIPSSIRMMTNLRELDLSYNQINFVPDLFENLTNLQIINLEFNRILPSQPKII
jgi:internalin A